MLAAREALGLSACEPASMEAHQAAVAEAYATSSAGSAKAVATVIAQLADESVADTALLDGVP